MRWNCNTECEYSLAGKSCSIQTDSIVGKPVFCCKFARQCEWIPESQGVVVNKEPLSDAEKSVFDQLRENANKHQEVPEKSTEERPKLTQKIFDRVKKDPKWICATVNKGGKAYFWTEPPTRYYVGGSWQLPSIENHAGTTIKRWREIKGTFDDSNWAESLIFRKDQNYYKVGSYVWYQDGFKFGVSAPKGFAKITALWDNSCRIQTETSDFSVRFTEIEPAYSVPWDFNNAPIALKVRNKKYPACQHVASLTHSGTGYQVKPGRPAVSFNVFHDEYEQLNGMPCGELKVGQK